MLSSPAVRAFAVVPATAFVRTLPVLFTKAIRAFAVGIDYERFHDSCTSGKRL